MSKFQDSGGKAELAMHLDIVLRKTDGKVMQGFSCNFEQSWTRAASCEFQRFKFGISTNINFLIT